jgi:hypothetical protein
VYTQAPCAVRNSGTPITQADVDRQNLRMNRMVQGGTLMLATRPQDSASNESGRPLNIPEAVDSLPFYTRRLELPDGKGWIEVQTGVGVANT